MGSETTARFLRPRQSRSLGGRDRESRGWEGKKKSFD